MPPRQVFLLLALVFSALGLRAQDALTLPQVQTLLDLGFSESEVLRVAQKDGITLVDGDAVLISRLSKFPILKEWLEGAASRQLQPRLSFQDVLTLWRSGAQESAIRDRIIQTKSTFDLSIDDVLSLARAQVPDSLIKLMRGTRDTNVLDLPARRRKMTLTDVIEETAKKTSPEDIVTLIRDSDSTFEVEARDIVELSRSGVDRSVLKEVYARRIITVETPASQPTSAASSRSQVPVSAAYMIHKGEGNAWTMLVPEGLTPTREFRGNRSIAQWSKMDESNDGVPQVELSVMRVIATEKDKATLSPGNLTPVATKFMEGVKTRFESDGIRMTIDSGKNAWISDHAAMSFQTAATTSKSHGLSGASYLVIADSSLYVLSYSCRSELTEPWRGILEECIRSFSFAAEAAMESSDSDVLSTDRDRIQRLFGRYKSCLYRFDWRTWRSLHSDLGDTVENRLSFVRHALEIGAKKQRLEIGRIDLEGNRVEYRLWMRDQEATTKTLNVQKNTDEWRIVVNATQ